MLYVYILECSNNSFYIGYTTTIERRYQEHCQGTSKCKYTRSFPPRRLVACWQFTTTKSAVLSLEWRLKKLSRLQKHQLVADPKLLANYTDKHFTIYHFNSDVS